MINYDRERGVEVVLGRYQSDLLIAKAQKTDAGNYTCAPSNAQSASIIVHILNSTLGKLFEKSHHTAMLNKILKSFSINFIEKCCVYAKKYIRS